MKLYHLKSFRFKWSVQSFLELRYKHAKRRIYRLWFRFLTAYEYHEYQVDLWLTRKILSLDHMLLSWVFYSEEYLRHYYPTLHWTLYLVFTSPILCVVFIIWNYVYSVLALLHLRIVYRAPFVGWDLIENDFYDVFSICFLPYLIYLIYCIIAMYLLERVQVIRADHIYYIAVIPLACVSWLVLLQLTYYGYYACSEFVDDRFLVPLDHLLMSSFRHYYLILLNLYGEFITSYSGLICVYQDRVYARRRISDIFSRESPSGRLRWGYDDDDLFIAYSRYPFRNFIFWGLSDRSMLYHRGPFVPYGGGDKFFGLGARRHSNSRNSFYY
jgi:hypothetical protein